MTPFEFYLAALGNDKIAAPNDGANNHAVSAFDCYTAGFNKAADLGDFNPSKTLSSGVNATGGLAHSVASGIYGGTGHAVDATYNGANLIGNTVAAPTRYLWNAAKDIYNGGTLGSAGSAGANAAADPILQSHETFMHDEPASAINPAAFAQHKANMASKTPPDFPAPALNLTTGVEKPSGLNFNPFGNSNSPAPSSPALSPASGSPGAGAPASVTAPKDWEAHFKKQTGSEFNPHSVADSIKMMGFKRGLNGVQADQASSLDNRKSMISGAGGASANNTLLSGLNSNPGSINLGVKPSSSLPLATR